MAELPTLASTLAAVRSDLARIEFERGFSQLQNTVIRRINDEIGKVNEEADQVDARTLDLQRRFKQLSDGLPVIQRYVFDNQSNYLRLQSISDDITTLQNVFGEDADSDNVSADEVTSFTTKRDALVAEFKRILTLFHPDVTDGNTITFLKNETDAIEALTPVVGVVDPEGTDPATNDNRAILTFLSTLKSKVDVAADVSAQTITAGFELDRLITRQLADIKTAFIERTELKQARRVAEVEALQQRFGGFLQAISLSFEVQSGLANSLNQALAPQRPPRGSILNLFT